MKTTKILAAIIAVMTCSASIASADLLIADYSSSADSTGVDSNGAYIWGMEVDPINNVANVDVDGNGVKDFHESGTTAVDTSDGYAGHLDGTLFRWDYTGSPPRQGGWEDAIGDGDYSFEVRLNLLGTGTEGSRGVFGVALEIGESPTQGQFQFEIGEDSLHWGTGTDTTGMSGSFANADNTGWHTWRFSFDRAELGDTNTSDILYVYKDGVLIDDGADGFDPAGFTGTPGNTFIGDYSGGLDGDWQLDYIAFDTTAATTAVPEPSSLMFVSALGLVVCRRRRK